jgi:hypothetical protein
MICYITFANIHNSDHLALDVKSRWLPSNALWLPFHIFNNMKQPGAIALTRGLGSANEVIMITIKYPLNISLFQ